MRAQRTTDTGPELAVRAALRRAGVGYRLHRSIRPTGGGRPIRPDVVLVGARTAVFVDGCWWHGCPLHAKAPGSNTSWWAQKLAANAERDERQTTLLQDDGWTVIRVWEHDDPDAVAVLVKAARDA